MTRRSQQLLGQAILLLLLAIVATGCAAGNGTYSTDQAGFFSGVWHGWIAPFALIGHIFDRDIRIYEPNNTGIWYDFGFYIAVISGFGSLSLRRTTKREKRRERRARRTGRAEYDD